MARKIKVAVLMGGKTPEHEISLITGREVVRNLPNKYQVLPVVISRTGEKWQIIGSRELLSLPDPLALRGTTRELLPKETAKIQGVSEVSDKGVDVVFIAMHGPFGEDGTVQGMLELAGLPYTGPGVLASALGMNKLLFRKVLESAGIKQPKYVVFEKKDKIKGIYHKLGKFPFFVKPHNQGSSVGISKAVNEKQLKRAINLAFKYSETLLIDECVEGMEVTCGILGNKNPKVLPLTEIIPIKGIFFDYQSKYSQGGAEEITPARISLSLTKKVQAISLRVYQILGCKGFSRIDFILRNNRTPVVLEINTIPGLTPTSLLPQQAKAAGLTYSQMLEEVINYALE